MVVKPLQTVVDGFIVYDMRRQGKDLYIGHLYTYLHVSLYILSQLCRNKHRQF